MAICQRGERCTKWTHLENGMVTNRKLHRLEVQGKDGRLYILEGDDLPEYFQTSAGVGYKGKHLGQILLNPKDLPPPKRAEFERWPSLRDTLHIGVGLTFAVLMLRILAKLAAEIQ